MKNIIISIILCIGISGILYSKDYPVFTESLLDALIESKVDKKDVLLIFGADWCKYCVIMKKDIENNLEDLEGLVINYVNIDKDPELAKEYKVKQLPDYMIIRDRKEIKRKVGYKNFDTFKRWLNDK